MKLFILSKKQIMLGLGIILSAVLIIIGSTAVFADKERKLPIYCVETEKKQVALSFDAAWGNDDTETLIKILKEYNAPATFFVVGSWVDKYPESVEALSKAGFQIQNHSNTHPHMTQLSMQQMKNEIEACNKKIESITGVCPTLLRPPYGDYDNCVVEAVENERMYAIQWSVDSLDWQDSATPQSIYKRVTDKVENGSIVLFHNDADHTPEALPMILKNLKEKGFEFVFISDLIMKENYHIDSTGKQCRTKDGE